jgi:DNA-binding CsgD family transcriptional regulator/tetratricopeptide (TPR) repeat protein
MGSGESGQNARPGPFTVREALFGRTGELGAITELTSRLDDGAGGALVIRGDAGIGKSALLATVAAAVAGRGISVLSASGVQSEARTPYAGLHQLLRPVLRQAGGLDQRQHAALLAAFGLSEGTAPEAFPIGLAVLDLIGDAVAPALMIVEDAHWLDPSSCAALAFVARRLGNDPVVLLVTVREGHRSAFDDAGLPELRLAGLDDEAAEELLDATAPGLDRILRMRILTEAAGNPLALVELPSALRSHRPDAGASLSRLPLTARLEWAFADRLPSLPAATRTLLLAAAADDDRVAGEVLEAASIVEGTRLTADDFTPAAVAGLVEIDAGKLRFRHSLVRSAIYQAAPWSRRRAVHAALAEVLAGQPDRQVWHRAAGAMGPDEQVAAELEDAAGRAERRGAIAIAISALHRASELSTTADSRGARFVRAIAMALSFGYPGTGVELLRAAESLDLPPDQRTWLSWVREAYSESSWSGAANVGSFVEIADRMIASGQSRFAMEPLLNIAQRCWWGNPTRETRASVVAAAERMSLPEDDAARLTVLALADPVNLGASLRDRLSRISPSAIDNVDAYLLGTAAAACWDYPLALRFIDPAISVLRAQGRAAALQQALVTQAWAAAHLAREYVAISAADEAFRLADETGQRRLMIAAALAKALIAAERGERDTVDKLTRDAEAVLIRMGADPMLALVQFVRGKFDVGHQRYEEGFEHLRRILDPGDPAYLPFVGAWGLADLVEASSQTGREDAARSYLTRLESLAGQTQSPFLRAQAGYARPLVADDDQAEELYRAALERDLIGWPCFRGRMLLWYGRWLRRQRRVVDSRVPLRAARDTFDAIAFADLAEIARQELRASGETSRGRMPDASDRLTPQELQIARMAAEGMSNREIGQRLYLSHRTVGYHLHRIYPKLGVTSRSQLHAALS